MPNDYVSPCNLSSKFSCFQNILEAALKTTIYHVTALLLELLDLSVWLCHTNTTMHQFHKPQCTIFVTEMCTCVHISVTKWCNVGYLMQCEICGTDLLLYVFFKIWGWYSRECCIHISLLDISICIFHNHQQPNCKGLRMTQLFNSRSQCSHLSSSRQWVPSVHGGTLSTKCHLKPSVT